jgi:hypothetical protein
VRLTGLALAWPLPSGPLGWQRLPGQRRAAGASRVAGCEAPLRLEGPVRTVRGVPSPTVVLLPRWRIWRVPDGLVPHGWARRREIRRAPHAAGHRGHRARQLGAP